MSYLAVPISLGKREWDGFFVIYPINLVVMNCLKRSIFCFTLLFVSINIFAQIVFYVTPTGAGQGTSWIDANQDINTVLFAAKPGDEIWIAKGTYLPTRDNNRKMAFSIPSNVRVYGGFSGNEANLKQRNIYENETILSGEINTPSTDDNSYNVVVFKNAGKDTVLDGFIISGGTGNGTGTTGARNRCGGGIYVDGSDNDSSPIIANCIVKNNVSGDGGAVYNNGISGNASPTFVNCSFASNRSYFDGGGIFNDGRKGGQSNPTFINCNIFSNRANYGGGICNYAGGGESSPFFDRCQFKNNKADVEGDAMFNVSFSGKCRPIIKNTSIAENQSVKNNKQQMQTFKTKIKVKAIKKEKINSL